MSALATLGNREAQDVDAALARAHAEGDLEALATLYAEAGFAREAAGDREAGCFLLTQAYVFALSAGSARAGVLFQALRARGREAGEFRVP